VKLKHITDKRTKPGSDLQHLWK